jgi:putative RNA 2'-phosphotransferase
MKHSQSLVKLSKFLSYILGKQPDEFGLVPDESGYILTKDLMKVMGEEEGWRHVRLSHIKEVAYTIQPSVIEIKENQIRSVDRSSLFSPIIPVTLPKLLYHPIRRRAYFFVYERGLHDAPSGNHFILLKDIEFAERLGRRIDQNPVILTLHTDQAIEKRANIKQFGKLFITDCIPHGCFTGPPLPKERPAAKKPEQAVSPEKPKTPGSYLLDLSFDKPTSDRPKKRKERNKNEWKRERKRRNKNRGFH